MSDDEIERMLRDPSHTVALAQRWAIFQTIAATLYHDSAALARFEAWLIEQQTETLRREGWRVTDDAQPVAKEYAFQRIAHSAEGKHDCWANGCAWVWCEPEEAQAATVRIELAVYRMPPRDVSGAYSIEQETERG